MKLDKVITDLDRLVSWGAKNGKITGKALEGFQEALKSLVEIYKEHEYKSLEYDAGLAVAAEANDKLKAALRCCGLSPKAITVLMKMESDFIDRYIEIARKGYPASNELGFEFMLAYHRGVELRIEGDLENVRHYSFVKNLAAKGTVRADSLEPHLQFMREHFPHLKKYFDMIEDGRITTEQEMRSELFKHHLWN